MSTATDSRFNRNNFRNTKVLVIEDNADHFMLIQKAMHHWLPNITLVHTTTEEHALAHLDDCLGQEWNLPKLILLDLYLPERKDGWQLLQRIKEMPTPCRQVPIVVLSYSGQTEDIITSYQLGASSYIVKPTTYQEWLDYFALIRTYWWETVTLPKPTFEL